MDIYLFEVGVGVAEVVLKLKLNSEDEVKTAGSYRLQNIQTYRRCMG